MIRRADDGTPTGILHEHAGKLVDPAIPRRSDARLAEAVAAYAERLLAMGVVAAQDPGELFDEPELRWGPTFYARLAAEGRLPLRVAGSIRPDQLPRAIERGFRSGDTVRAVDTGNERAARRAAFYRGGWLKQFADGSLGSRSAALLAPYEPEPGGPVPVGGPAGMLLDAPQVLWERARVAVEAGIAVQIHGIGDRAVRVALDILARLPRHPAGVSHRVEHAQLVDPEDQARFGQLGIVASMQAVHLVSDAVPTRTAWGTRSANAFPLRAVLASGGVVAMGTDAPVESPDPWPGIAIAVTRSAEPWGSRDGAFHPEHGITLDEGLRAACIAPPLSAGEADRGRLIEGQVADFVVLGAEALDEPPTVGGALATARPLATVLDGEVVYRDPSFDR